MPDDIYQMIIAARDLATPQLAKVSAATKGMQATAGGASGALGKLGTVTGGLVTPTTAALGAVAALSVGLVKALENAKADQASQRLLGAALEANIPAWDGNTEAIEKVIDARLKLGFTDEEQRTSLRQLVAQTKDVNIALEIQRTAMDLARLRSIDLTTASTLLGKVYGGNVGILARYGIQLAKGTTAQEAFAEVQRRASGQASAWADGLEGQTAALGIAFDELGERVGYALIEPMTDLVHFANESLVPALEDVLDAATALGDFLGAEPPGTFLGMDIDEMAVNLHNALVDIGISMGIPGDRITVESVRGKAAAKEYGKQIGQGFGEGTAGAIDYMRNAASHVLRVPLVDAARTAHDSVTRIYGTIPGDVADALTTNYKDVRDAIKDARELERTEWAKSRQVAYLESVLTSKEYLRGIHDRRPEVRALWRQIGQDTRQELRQIRSGAEDAAADGMAAYNRQLRVRGQTSAAIAGNVAKAVQTKLGFDASDQGAAVADTYIDALATGIASPGNVAQVQGALNHMAGVTIGNSMPKSGPMSARKVSEGARDIATHFTSEMGRHLSGGFDLGGIRPAGNGRRGGGATITVNINSTLPPSPAQGQAIARSIGPELVRWLSQNA